MYAVIEGERVKVERIDFFQSSFAIFIKDSETTEKMVPSSKIDSIEHLPQIYKSAANKEKRPKLGNSNNQLKKLLWKLDREIWAKVEVHEATQSWGREQSGILINEYTDGILSAADEVINTTQDYLVHLSGQEVVCKIDNTDLVSKMLSAIEKYKALKISK